MLNKPTAFIFRFLNYRVKYKNVKKIATFQCRIRLYVDVNLNLVKGRPLILTVSLPPADIFYGKISYVNVTDNISTWGLVNRNQAIQIHVHLVSANADLMNIPCSTHELNFKIDAKDVSIYCN